MCKFIQKFSYKGQAKSIYRSLYFYLINYISSNYPQHLSDSLLNTVAQQAFKFAFKSFSYTSDVGLAYMQEVAQTLYKYEPKLFSGHSYIYAPELMIHLSKDYFSAGKYHIDCSKEMNNYYTSWSPLFTSNYSQISFKYNDRVIPRQIDKSSFILFPGNIFHKGNYNYTLKDHCALVVRITIDKPTHVGKYLLASHDPKGLLFDTSNYAYFRPHLSHITDIYSSTFDFLQSYLVSPEKERLVNRYISSLPKSHEFNQFYRLYFGYSYFADYIDSMGSDSRYIKNIARYINA